MKRKKKILKQPKKKDVTMGFLKLACVSKIPPHILSDAKKASFDTVGKH